MLVIFVNPTGTNEICSNEIIIAFRKTIIVWMGYQIKVITMLTSSDV